MGFPGGSDGKESACSAGDLPGFDSWVGKMPWRRECLPTPVFLPGEFCGFRGAWQSTVMGSQRVGHNHDRMSDTFTLTDWIVLNEEKYKVDIKCGAIICI